MAVSGPRSSWPIVARSSALNDSVSCDTRGALAGSSCVAILLLSIFHWRELSVEERRLPVIASRGARYSGKGRVQEPPASLPMVAASQQRSLAYRVERDEHQRDQPGQDHYADDDRIDITMDSLEHIPLTHLSFACTGGCSASPAWVYSPGWGSFSDGRARVPSQAPFSP